MQRGVIWRREGDSNSRVSCPTLGFRDQPGMTTSVSLQAKKLLLQPQVYNICAETRKDHGVFQTVKITLTHGKL